MTLSNKTAALAAALALVLSGAALAQSPQPATDPTMDPAPADTSFEQLDKDADGYVVKTDIPAEHELALQFAIADSDKDSRLSRAEFDAYVDAPEEEEAEE